VLIAGNWKMYKGPVETAEFCIELRRRLADLEGVDVAVCPPFTSLAVAVQVLAGTDIAVALNAENGTELGRFDQMLGWSFLGQGRTIFSTARRNKETGSGTCRRAA